MSDAVGMRQRLKLHNYRAGRGAKSRGMLDRQPSSCMIGQSIRCGRRLLADVATALHETVSARSVLE
jgi:hypothetical protein